MEVGSFEANAQAKDLFKFDNELLESLTFCKIRKILNIWWQSKCNCLKYTTESFSSLDLNSMIMVADWQEINLFTFLSLLINYLKTPSFFSSIHPCYYTRKKQKSISWIFKINKDKDKNTFRLTRTWKQMKLCSYLKIYCFCNNCCDILQKRQKMLHSHFKNGSVKTA